MRQAQVSDNLEQHRTPREPEHFSSRTLWILLAVAAVVVASVAILVLVF